MKRIIKIFMKYTVMMLFILSSLISGQAKSFYVIHGYISERKTNLPIQDVNIQIASSLIGTSTDKNGHFQISGLTQGTYYLIISYVGYETETQKVRLINKLQSPLYITLEKTVYQLPEIIVSAKEQKEWQKNFEIFQFQFLGESYNGLNSEILNPEVISFSRDSADYLHATAYEDILIDNLALGYRIKYTLKSFDFGKNHLRYSGFSTFQELEPLSEDEYNDWLINREQTFYGSLNHFLITIAANFLSSDKWQLYFDGTNNLKLKQQDKLVELDYLYEEGFTVFETESVKPVSLNSPFAERISINGCISKGEIETELKISFKNFLQIIYDLEYEEVEYLIAQHTNRQPKYQCSFIELGSDTVTFDIYGRYYDEFMIKTYGYWGFKRICDTLPVEYFINKFEE